MATWQFQTHLNPNQTVTIPPEVANQLSPEMPIQVVLTTGECSEDSDWQRLDSEQFVQGYAPGDDIYDDLPAG